MFRAASGEPPPAEGETKELVKKRMTPATVLQMTWAHQENQAVECRNLENWRSSILRPVEWRGGGGWSV
jgi:hypothetical protein